MAEFKHLVTISFREAYIIFIMSASFLWGFIAISNGYNLMSLYAFSIFLVSMASYFLIGMIREETKRSVLYVEEFKNDVMGRIRELDKQTKKFINKPVQQQQDDNNND